MMRTLIYINSVHPLIKNQLLIMKILIYSKNLMK